MLTNVIAIASILIAAASLWVSIKVYRRDTPRLTIQIPEPKFDCFFGNVQNNYNSNEHIDRVCGVHCLLNNIAQYDIEVVDAFLIIQREKYRIISNDNHYWENVAFLVADYDNPNMCIPDENHCINYAENGLCLPFKIKAYSSFDGYMLFYNFPAKIKKQVPATLCIRTPMGVTKKKLKLLEYDDTFAKQEWEEVQQYYKSLEE